MSPPFLREAVWQRAGLLLLALVVGLFYSGIDALLDHSAPRHQAQNEHSEDGPGLPPFHLVEYNAAPKPPPCNAASSANFSAIPSPGRRSRNTLRRFGADQGQFSGFPLSLPSEPHRAGALRQPDPLEHRRVRAAGAPARALSALQCIHTYHLHQRRCFLDSWHTSLHRYFAGSLIVILLSTVIAHAASSSLEGLITYAGTGKPQSGIDVRVVEGRKTGNHLSFIKDFAPEYGRNFKVTYTMNFF